MTTTETTMRDRIEQTVRALAENIGPRSPGSAAEYEAAQYLHDALIGIGLASHIEAFESASDLAMSAILAVGDDEIGCMPVMFSPADEVTGNLIFIGNDISTPPNGTSVKGDIGLLAAGPDMFARHDTIQAWEAAGLAAMIVACPTPDRINGKIVRTPRIERMPVVAVSWRDGWRLMRRAGETARVSVTHEQTKRHTSQNVTATIPAATDTPEWIALGAHYDTAPGCPGAADNAAGVAVIIELARQLRDATLAVNIEVVLTGSEEFGGDDFISRGARAFINNRNDRIEHCLGYVDVCYVGAPMGVPQLFAGGPKPFCDAVLSAPQRLNPQPRGKAFVGGDQGAAEQTGVPHVRLIDGLSSAQPGYHTADDNMDHLNLDILPDYVHDAHLILDAVAIAPRALKWVHGDACLIRPAQQGDVDAICEITADAFGPVSMDRMREEHFATQLGGNSWQVHKCGVLRRWLHENLYTTIVAETEGRIVGYATYLLHADKDIAEIGNNAVAPAQQGKGIGSALQREVLARIKREGYRRLMVTTLSHDEPAIRMYERLGAEPYARSVHLLAELD